MIGSATDTTSKALLNWLTGTSLGSWVPPTTTYLALLTVDPSTTAAVPTDPQVSELQEITATGYSRQVISWNSATTPTGGTSQIQNSSTVTFGPFTGASGSGSPTTFGALVTSASGSSGEVLFTWQWDSPVLAVQNQPIQILSGSLDIFQQ